MATQAKLTNEELLAEEARRHERRMAEGVFLPCRFCGGAAAAGQPHTAGCLVEKALIAEFVETWIAIQQPQVRIA